MYYLYFVKQNMTSVFFQENIERFSKVLWYGHPRDSDLWTPKGYKQYLYDIMHGYGFNPTFFLHSLQASGWKHKKVDHRDPWDSARVASALYHAYSQDVWENILKSALMIEPYHFSKSLEILKISI